jgi:hypothetical protein
MFVDFHSFEFSAHSVSRSENCQRVGFRWFGYPDAEFRETPNKIFERHSTMILRFKTSPINIENSNLRCFENIPSELAIEFA